MMQSIHLKSWTSVHFLMQYAAEVAIGLRRNPRESLSYALSRLTTPLEIPKEMSKVVIKPSIYDPKLLGNTNPDVVRAVINSFKSLGHVYVVESDNLLRTASQAFSSTRYVSLIEDGVDLVNLSEQPAKRIQMPGHYFKDHSLPVLLLSNCFLINIPTVKLEPSTDLLGAGIKNLFGFLPETDKRIYHQRIDDVLIDILRVFRPHLTVVDLTKIVIGKREDGISREAGAILVGRDPIAVDAVCAELFGITPMKIPYLKKAHELGLGEGLIDRIRIIATEEQKDKLSKLCQL